MFYSLTVDFNPNSIRNHDWHMHNFKNAGRSGLELILELNAIDVDKVRKIMREVDERRQIIKIIETWQKKTGDKSFEILETISNKALQLYIDKNINELEIYAAKSKADYNEEYKKPTETVRAWIERLDRQKIKNEKLEKDKQFWIEYEKCKKKPKQSKEAKKDCQISLESTKLKIFNRMRPQLE